MTNWLSIFDNLGDLVPAAHAVTDQPTIKIPPPTSGFSGSIGELVATGINWAVAIGAIATLAYIILGGFQYVTAGDDAEQAEGARAHITNGVIGLIIIASAYAIFQLLIRVLNLEKIFTGGGVWV